MNDVLASISTAPVPITAFKVTVYSTYESDAPSRSLSLKKVNTRVSGRKLIVVKTIGSLTSIEYTISQKSGVATNFVATIEWLVSVKVYSWSSIC